jgi:Fur family ferric uptake transcriptional regulator
MSSKRQTRRKQRGLDRPRLEEIFDGVRKAGGRLTPARRAILEALVASEDHLSSEALVDFVLRRIPGTDRSTVYRNLASLEQLGVVGHIHLGHTRSVWHLAGAAHHHLLCEKCGKVSQVPLQAFDAITERLESEYGFKSDTAHFAIVGTCRGCRSS